VNQADVSCDHQFSLSCVLEISCISTCRDCWFFIIKAAFFMPLCLCM
jgi:hypothetical protein